MATGRNTVGEDTDVPPITGLYPQDSIPRRQAASVLSASNFEAAQHLNSSTKPVYKERVSHVSGHHRIMEPPEGALVTMVLEMGSKGLLDTRNEIRS